MSMESDLRAYLLGVPAITALVAQRIHPIVVPQESAMPAVSFSVALIDEQGVLGGGAGLAIAHVVFACLGESYLDQVVVVAAALRAALLGKKRFVQGGTTFQSIMLAEGGQRDAGFDNDSGHFQRDIQFEVTYEVTIPN